ncbi:AMP-binding protein [Rhizobium sp. P40RR-XXII]|uniref:AMP-binding protein n=1 Tax=Rhizobium sp. P40RR-XXII TaxID=2726739 RepID=UPI0014571E0A
MRFLFDSIERHLTERPSQIVVADTHQTLTWTDLRNAVANYRKKLATNEKILGLLAPNGCEYVVALLAAAAEGKTLVPLPTFFSDAQLSKIIGDASINRILVTEEIVQRATRLGAPHSVVNLDTADCTWSAPVESFETIIYTSGSGGQPKGVRHTSIQIEAVVQSLGAASAATAEDRYLSLLPLPMLLETICAVFLPLFSGARVYFDARIAEGVAAGRVSELSKAIIDGDPTATVLVPQLLKAWLFEMRAMRIPPPSGLRFVAVGGAPVSRAVLDLAENMGVPVFEGYGLSECCSVVTLNRTDDSKPGTSGKPLSGVTIAIDNGEIVVDGPTVMQGYLGSPLTGRSWRTGDLGTIDEDGFLTVHGRKDNLIVTSFGRNISPEWVETALMADPRIALAIISGSGQSALHAVLVPTAFGESWFTTASQKDVHCLIATLCSDLPAYAVPQAYQTLSISDALKAKLMTTNGRPIRCRFNDYVATSTHQTAAQ